MCLTATIASAVNPATVHSVVIIATTTHQRHLM
jgi:hypothetical protein